MADNKVTFELVAPERLLFSSEVDMVVVPGSEGDFGVLPGHAPLIAAVRPGVIDVYDGGLDANAIKERIFVAGGVAEVTETRCIVLAEQAVPVTDLNATDAQVRLEAAREHLAEATTEEARHRAEREISIAEAMTAAVR